MKEHIKPHTVHLDFITRLKAGTYRFEGYYFGKDVLPKCSVVLQTSDKKIITVAAERPDLYSRHAGDETSAFTVEVALKDTDKIEFLYGSMEKDELRPVDRIHTGMYTHISPLRFAYRKENGYLLRNMSKRLTFSRAAKARVIWYELTFLARLMVYWRTDSAKAALIDLFRSRKKISAKMVIFGLAKPVFIVAEAVATIPRALVVRGIYHIYRHRVTRPIWIISDRGMAAGDNGEALFRHTLSRNDAYADIYFVISKKSKDYKKLKTLSATKILNQSSLKYHVMFLLASKIISSHADIEVTNPFLRQRYHYQDLVNHEFVFLQHGVIRYDHSQWLNRYNKNIALFVTSAKKEYESILECNYGYSQEQVVLTGLPRFDLLESEPKGKLILAPTYRRELARLPTDKNGVRPYDPEFKHTEYFRTYQRILTDDDLVAMLNKHGMTLEFYLHPNLHNQAKDFTGTNVTIVKEYPYSYAEAMKEGDIFITDYSSASFDFAYLKKPVIYYQFDKDMFFRHGLSVESEFFSDETDGFGPVVYDHQSLIETVLFMVENREMESKYAKRVDDFFYKIDKENSKRVYDEIVKLDSKV